MRAIATGILFIAVALISAPSARAVDCVDYGYYIHRAAFIELAAPGHDLALAGDLLYVVDEEGLRVFDVTDPEDPQPVGELAIPSASCLALRGDIAYVGCEAGDFRAVDIADPATPAILAGLAIPMPATDIELAGDFAYVTVGEAGLQILDLAIPELPSLHTIVDTPRHAHDLVIQGDHAYIADRNNLVVVDITDLPTEPLAPPGRPGPSLISVAVGFDHAYLLDTTFGLQIYDVTDPLDPQWLGDLPGAGEGKMEIVGDRLYVGIFPGLRIYDVSTPAAPVRIGEVNAGGSTDGLLVDGDHVYQAIRSPGAVDIMDISNIDPPPELGSIDLSGWPYGMSMSPPYAYLASRFYGLQVVDTSEPGSMVDLGYVSEVESARQTIVAGSLAYVAGEEHGLYVLDITKPGLPQVLSLQSMGGSLVDMAKQGDWIYGANWNGLRVIDVSDPLDPAVVGFLDTDWNAHHVAVHGDHVILATTLELLVVDVAVPTDPQIIASFYIQAKNLAARGDRLYVSTLGHLDIYSLTDLPELTPVGLALLPNYCIGMSFKGDLAYLAMGSGGMQVLDVSDPALPRSVGSSPYWPMGVYASDERLYMVDTHKLYALPLHCTLTGLGEEPPAVQARARLHANHPNPFNPNTRLGFTLAQAARVELSIHDCRGRLLRSLLSGVHREAGRHELNWNGRDGAGRELGSGVYFTRLRVGEQVLGESMILLR